MHHIYDDGAFVAFVWNNLDKVTIDSMIDYSLEYRRDPKEREQEAVSKALNKTLDEYKDIEIITSDGKVTTLDDISGFGYLIQATADNKNITNINGELE